MCTLSNMKIQHILISQPTPTTDKNPFADLACKHDVNIEFKPFVNIEKVSLKEFRAQRVEILEHDAAIFTSRTAIDHFFAIAEQARIAIPESFKYFCVTETIALYLQKYIVYRKRKIFFGKATFTDLMEVIAKHKELKFLFPLCDQHKPELPITLTRTGVKFSKLIISHSVMADLSDIAPEKYNLMVCYSPAEVKAMAEMLSNISHNCKIATFGNATATAVFDHGMTVDLAVPAPSMPSMTMAIDKFLSACKDNNDLEVFALRTPPANVGTAASKNIATSKSPRATAK